MVEKSNILIGFHVGHPKLQLQHILLPLGVCLDPLILLKIPEGAQTQRFLRTKIRASAAKVAVLVIGDGAELGGTAVFAIQKGVSVAEII